VRLVYGGLTGANGGLNNSDGVSTVLFNDPNGDIPGTFNCASGGIVAMTIWRSSGTADFNGRTFGVMTEADTVVQDGAGCVLSRNNNAAEVLAHELGHALGLAHPCGDAGLVSCVVNTLLNQALMRPILHGDGRGASLRTDDLAGIATPLPGCRELVSAVIGRRIQRWRIQRWRRRGDGRANAGRAIAVLARQRLRLAGASAATVISRE